MQSDVMKVLLVEDNPGDARLVSEALKESGENQTELKHVETFQNAVDILNSEAFQLILLDLTLPDSQGVETFSRMKKMFPNIPIVVLTGYEDENMAFDALQEGIEIYLIKGKVDANLLKQALEYAVKKSRLLSEMEE